MDPRYHVFLSHSSADKPAVEMIARKLREAGIKLFFDKWHLVPGEPWQEALEEALGQSSTCAVFFGPGGLGPWHNEEMRAVLDQRAHNPSFRVIPVLLPEATQPGAQDLPRFLTRLTWVDFRLGMEDKGAFHRLVSGIKGIPPGGEAAHDAVPTTVDDLPVDEVPPPGLLPAISRMPLPHNPFFVGREEDLKILARQLKAGEISAVGQVKVAAATGLGGIGKTQLASEFVYRYGRFFAGGVFWMSFADAANVPVEVADCGRSLGLLAGFDALTLKQQIRLVEEAWRSPLPPLLVFDNCEEEELLQSWCPRSGNARVLVTSRRPEWDPILGVKTVPLTTLPRPASIELLRLFRPDLDDEPAFDAIARELGDLPLALHMAGSFLKTYRGSPIGQPAAYLETLRQKNLLGHPSLQGWGSGLSPTRHERDVGRTFDLSFERLDAANSRDALAVDLLARASWFAPGEPIPRFLLLKTAQLKTADLSTSLLIEDALLRLIALGLLEANDQNDLLMHRLIAAWARGVAGGDKAQMAVEETILEEAKRLNETRNPASLQHWQPHLRATTNRAMEREDKTAARLCDEFGLHLWLAGDYSGARPYLERSIAVHEAVSGPEHEDIARSLNIMGAIFNYLQDFHAARPYLERALAIREKILGSEHSETAESLNDIGFLLASQGDYDGARPYHERALAIREKTLGQEHPDTARSLSNLGGLLRAIKDFEGARAYFERALAIEEKALGPEHPDTARCLSSLGGLREDRGDFGGARSYYERTLKIREKVLGPEHPDTAESLMSLGTLYFDQGNMGKARRYLELALALLTARLGPGHPRTNELRRYLSKLPGARRLKAQRSKRKT